MFILWTLRQGIQTHFIISVINKAIDSYPQFVAINRLARQ